jgi:peptide/nickel transport system permease protein
MKYRLFHRKRSLSYSLSILWLIFLSVLAVLGPFIASDKPLYCHQYTTTQTGDSCTQAVMPLIPFAASRIQLKDRLSPPLTASNADTTHLHLLGTDHLGRDIASGIVTGLRKSLMIGIGSMLICLLLGLIVGFAGAWYGDVGIQVSRTGHVVRWLLLILLGALLVYILTLFLDRLISISQLVIHLGWIIGMLLLSFWIIRRQELQLPTDQIKDTIRLDSILSRVIELFQSLPVMMLLIALTATIGQHNTLSLILVLILIRWPLAARFVRAEILQLRQQPFMQIARQRQLSFFVLLFRELLPNLIPVLIALFAFGVSSAILLEATLTFLGLGLPLEQVSWGSMILDGRQHPKAWWLVTFPGMFLLLTIGSLLIVGEQIQRVRGAQYKPIRFF